MYRGSNVDITHLVNYECWMAKEFNEKDSIIGKPGSRGIFSAKNVSS